MKDKLSQLDLHGERLKAYPVSGKKIPVWSSSSPPPPHPPPVSCRPDLSNLRSKSPLCKKYHRSLVFQLIPSIKMANADILKIEELLHFSIFDLPPGEGIKSRGQLIERKIEALEKLVGKVSNRRSHRWLNDRLLIELVPRLKVEEIRGLFAPPPWGERTALSAFCLTNVEEWDAFRNIDMDKEARLIRELEKLPSRRKGSVEKDKLVALNAWHRVDCRSREAFRHNLLSELVENYEEQILAFIKERSDEDVLKLYVQNPFHRLLLHGVCEYYNLISATVPTKNPDLLKVTTIRKKKTGSKEEAPPAISLTQFLKISKDGVPVGLN